MHSNIQGGYLQLIREVKAKLLKRLTLEKNVKHINTYSS